jgi:hypothetical protein
MPADAARLGKRLTQFGSIFQLLAILGALGAIAASIEAGSENLTQWERDMETAWRVTTAVIVWWAIAIGALIQGFWLSWVSEALAELLRKTAPHGGA